MVGNAIWSLQCPKYIHDGNEWCISTILRWVFSCNLDEILVFSKQWDDHVKDYKHVLDILQIEKLYVKLSKSEFGKTCLVYLGHIIGGGQLKIDPSKVDVIVKFPKPTNDTKMRSFLGVVQFWRRFITNFSVIASPFHAITSVKQISHWGGKQHKDFNTLKENISTTLVLALTYLQQPLTIKENANGYAMSGVLML